MSSGGPFLEEYGLPGAKDFSLLIFFSSEKKKLHGSFLFFGKFHIFFFGGGTSKLKRFEQISLNFQVLVGALQIKYWLEMVGKPLPVTSTTLTTLVKGDGENFKLPVKSLVGSSFFLGKTTCILEWIFQPRHLRVLRFG